MIKHPREAPIMTNFWNFLRWCLERHDRHEAFRLILEQHEQELYG